MPYLPHEKLAIKWSNNDTQLTIALPWLSMELDVIDSEKSWIEDATAHLHSDPLNDNTQKFIHDLKDYPIFYYKPRTLEDFKEYDLQEGTAYDEINLSTPLSFFQSSQIPADPSLIKDIPQKWTWEWDKILQKAHIEGTDLYDPLSSEIALDPSILIFHGNCTLGASPLVTEAEVEAVAMSKKSQVIRLNLSEIPSLGRSTQGVRIMKLRPGDSIASFVCL